MSVLTHILAPFQRKLYYSFSINTHTCRSPFALCILSFYFHILRRLPTFQDNLDVLFVVYSMSPLPPGSFLKFAIVFLVIISSPAVAKSIDQPRTLKDVFSCPDCPFDVTFSQPSSQGPAPPRSFLSRPLSLRPSLRLPTNTYVSLPMAAATLVVP